MPSKFLALVADRDLARRAVKPVSAFVLVVIAGVVGFVFLGDVGVVEATFWLIDPASIELHFHEYGGDGRLVKVYSIFVTSGIVVASLWIGETVLSAAFEGRITRQLAAARNERQLMDTENHVIICGYGMFGRTVARDVDADGGTVVVIEREDDQRQRAAEDGHLVVDGDARREPTLSEARVETAQTLVTAIDDSSANLQTTITARQLAPETRIVTRIGDENYESLARRAGADEVIVPEVASGRSVAGDLLSAPN